MYEYHNKRSNVTIELIKEIEKVYECNLMGKNIEEAEFKEN